ncbi:MAG: hypothetical protein WD597_11205, partial [Balneolaceae bacterium]
MNSVISREQVSKKLRDEWLPDIRKELISSIEKDAHELNQILNSSGKLSEQEKAEKLFSKLSQLNSAKAENSEWIESIKSITSQIEDEVVFVQDEDRFQALEGDSILFRSRKMGKRGFRFIQRGAHAIGNGIRSISGHPQKQKPEWHQKIPLQKVVEFELFELSSVVQNWEHEQRKLKAELLVQADAWLLSSNGLQVKNPNKEEDEESREEWNPQIPDDLEQIQRLAQEKLSKLLKNQSQTIKEAFEGISKNIIHEISITDTIERKASDYSDNRVSAKKARIIQREQEFFKQWNALLDMLCDRMSLSLDFTELHSQFNERVQGFGESLTEFFTENIQKPKHELDERLSETILVFDETEKHSLKERQKLSGKLRDELNEIVENSLIRPIQYLIEEAILSTKLNGFISAIPGWTNGLSEKAIFVEELDMAKFPPEYDYEEINWQVLVQRVINNHLVINFLPKEIKPEQFLIELIQDFREISEIILTNLEIADEVKKADEEEPFQVAREGLERAKVKLAEISQKVEEKREGLVNSLRDKEKIAFSKLATLLLKQDVSETRITGAQYMAKEAAVGWKVKLQVGWAKFGDKAELFARFFGKKGKLYFENTRKFLGFREAEIIEGDKSDLATFLSETDEKMERLPFIYRRLFDFQKEVDDRFFVGRPEQFERLKKGYELWKNNFPSTFAVVGEKGSGKSLFVRLWVEENITKHDVVDVTFKDTIWKPEGMVAIICDALKIKDVTTVEELIAAIQRKKKRTVVTLENVQNCFIRNISGFDAFEHLMYLISETNKEILWIVSSTRYGWLYLDKVLNAVDYFTHVIQTDQLNASQIEDLILKRHRASGYQLIFIPEESVKKSRSFRKL